jgi:hypothetical protein
MKLRIRGLAGWHITHERITCTENTRIGLGVDWIHLAQFRDLIMDTFVDHGESPGVVNI